MADDGELLKDVALENKLLRRLLSDHERESGKRVIAVELGIGEQEGCVRFLVTAPTVMSELSFGQMVANFVLAGWKASGALGEHPEVESNG